MNRTIAYVIAALLAISTHAEDPTGPNLDIAGIKIGMGVKEAMAALKADNPKLQIQTPAHKLEGFSAPMHSFVSSAQTISPDNDGEAISLLFTMPPSREVVWGIKRVTNYRAGHRPSTDNTLAALRAKYGPENIPSTYPRTQNIVWVFDDKGQLLPADQAKKVSLSCGSQLDSHFNNEDIASLNDIQLGKYGPPECSAITLITASVQSTDGPDGSSKLVVYNLIVEINHAPLYRAAIEATREIVIRAVKARENKASEETDNVGKPKL